MAVSPSRGRRQKPPGRFRRLVIRIPRRAWIGLGTVAFLVTLAVVGVLAYWWVTFSEPIEARLHGERDRVLPRVYARPLELYRGQAIGERQLVDRLNDLGYAQRARVEGRLRPVPNTPERCPSGP